MQVKFCGMTNLEDVKNALDLGVDYIGFIVDFPQSPRSISIEKFNGLAGELRTLKSASRDFPKIVAVTVNMDEKKIASILATGLIDVLQFHGDEIPEFCGNYKSKAEVWRSFKIRADDEFNKTLSKLEKFKGKIDRFLIDASSYQDKAKGAENRFENFQIYKELSARGYPLILAGGINADNIKLHLKELNPEIVDAASGIEKSPGEKSLKKMNQFLENIKI